MNLWILRNGVTSGLNLRGEMLLDDISASIMTLPSCTHHLQSPQPWNTLLSLYCNTRRLLFVTAHKLCDLMSQRPSAGFRSTCIDTPWTHRWVRRWDEQANKDDEPWQVNCWEALMTALNKSSPHSLFFPTFPAYICIGDI